MANTPIGAIWSTKRGTTVPTQLLACDAINTPVCNDIVIVGAGGDIEFYASTGAAATLAARTIKGICVTGITDGKLKTPGYTAGTDSSAPIASFGGAGSRASSLNPVLQRNIAVITNEDKFVMSPTAEATVGSNYGLNRVAAGDYVVDVTDAQDVVQVLSKFQPDVLENALLAAAGKVAIVNRVWVKFLNCG